MTRMPVAFVSHGAPTLALDPVHGADLTRWAQALPQPRAVLVVSAHWEATPARIGTSETLDLLYDFSGFDRALYDLRYAAPAATELAADLRRLYPDLAQDDARPWDHGVWVPLLHMYPGADVPVLQLSLPSRAAPAAIVELGRRLEPLRDDGVLILASGGMVHNLRRLEWSDTAATPPSWATAFEAWVRARLDRGAWDQIVTFRETGPDVALAHPTHEHFLPLLVALGAAGAPPWRVSYPIEGFEFGSLSRLCVQLD